MAIMPVQWLIHRCTTPGAGTGGAIVPLAWDWVLALVTALPGHLTAGAMVVLAVTMIHSGVARLMVPCIRITPLGAMAVMAIIMIHTGVVTTPGVAEAGVARLSLITMLL